MLLCSNEVKMTIVVPRRSAVYLFLSLSLPGLISQKGQRKQRTKSNEEQKKKKREAKKDDRQPG